MYTKCNLAFGVHRVAYTKFNLVFGVHREWLGDRKFLAFHDHMYTKCVLAFLGYTEWCTPNATYHLGYIESIVETGNSYHIVELGMTSVCVFLCC